MIVVAHGMVIYGTQRLCVLIVVVYFNNDIQYLSLRVGKIKQNIAILYHYISDWSVHIFFTHYT